MTNAVLEALLKRKSIRAYQPGEIPVDVRAQVLQATLRAPTAGNMMLYSILEITDQAIKDTLAKTCDDQPFIARAPMVWLFLADYQRWQDYFTASGVPELCAAEGKPMRTPQEGDLMLACCDALIAAQTAVVAAEALGLGSCYIGDILENCEQHRQLLNLPRYVFPICLVCFGYPTAQQVQREQPGRFDQKFILFENSYRRLEKPEFDEMFAERQAKMFNGRESIDGLVNAGQVMYRRKFSADFSLEMTRSVKVMLKDWEAG